MDEKSQNLIFFAVVLSVALHAGLMFFMRPQVMTRISYSGASARARAPMTMRDRPVSPETVRFDVMEDVAAQVEFPSASAVDVRPSADSTLNAAPDRPKLPHLSGEIGSAAVPRMGFDPSELLSTPAAETDAAPRPEAVSPLAPGAGSGFARAAAAEGSTDLYTRSFGAERNTEEKSQHRQAEDTADVIDPAERDDAAQDTDGGRDAAAAAPMR